MKRKRTLCIISVYRPDLLDEALQAIGVSQSVEVVFDRRAGERRRTPRAKTPEARRAERRRASIDEALARDGYAIVPPED